MTAADAGLAFGFVQRGVVADLQDVGNWKSRATAIDALHKQLRDVHSPSVLLHGLGDFVKFLVGLIADPNFKIAISSMSILGDLAGKVGNELEAHLRTIIPPLLEKFSDSKILVRAANMKVLRRLMGAVSPAAVLGLLGAGAAHSSWRVREEVLNAHIMAVLSFTRPSYDALAVYRLLSSCLGDTNPRVRVVAQEALAALHSRLAPGELAAWAAGQRGAGHALPEQQRQQLLARLGDKSLPCINSEGMVDHVVELPQGAAGAGSMGGAAVGEAGDLRLVDAAALGGAGGGGGGAGRHPWDAGAGAGPIATANTPARPRARPAGPLDMASGHSFVGARPLLGLGPLQVDGPAGGGAGGWGGPLTPGGGAGTGAAAAGRVAGVPMNEVIGGRHGHGLGHGEEGGLWSPAHRPVALPGTYAHPPSRLGSHDSAGGGGGSGGGAPASGGWGGGGVVHARSGSPTGAPGAGHHGHGHGYGYGLPDSALPPERHSTGGTAVERHSGGGLLQPLKHLWGGLRGVDSSDDSPLSPTRGYQSVIGSSRNSFSTQAPAARQETFSPSKAEMLARLKHRQIEKRVATAQMESSTASASELILSRSDIAGASSSFPAPSHPARRGLFSQLSDNARAERQHSGEFSGGPPAARGFHSVISTPTRPSGLGSCDDTPVGTPGSARPPRAGLGSRRAPLAVDTGAAGPMSRPSYTSSPASLGAHGSPAASEESPARNASPALGRYRARSADPQAAGLLGSVGPGAGPGSGGGTVPPTPSQAAAMGGSFWDKGGGTDDLGPLPDPERSIKTVIAKLVEANHADRKELDWQGQFDALVDGRRLARNHGDVLRAGAGVGASLHDFVRAATPAIDALRSTTAKCALGLFQDLFGYLGRVMDRELDEVVPVLLKKAGEVSNAGRDNFLAAEADRVLADMCRACGEARVLAALLGCAGHKNPYVRGKVAFHVDNHLEALAGAGAGRQALLNNWACLERAFKAAAAFLDEGSLETRTYGKRVIWHLKAMVASPSDFQRLVASVAPAALQRKVTDVIEGTNGPPPPPSRAAAGSVGRGGASRMGAPPSPARIRMDQGPGSLTAPPPPVRGGSFSAPAPLHGAPTPERRRAGARQQSGGPDLDGIPESVGSSRANSSAGGYTNGNAGSAGGGRGLTRRNSGLLGRAGSGGLGSGGGHSNGGGSGGGGGGYAAAFSPATQEVVVKALQLLGAKDFRERVEALRSVEGVAGALAGAPESLVVQLLDALVERLGDANVKVSMQALELVSTLAGSLRGRLSLGLNTMVPALAAALGSTSDKVRSVAIAATDALINTLEPAMLIQHFSHCVSNGNIQRGKPLLVEKLVAIVHALYGSKPQLVVRYAVPAAFALLNDGRGEGKAAANALLTALARCMGTGLIDQAATLNTAAQQRVADAVSAAMGHR